MSQFAYQAWAERVRELADAVQALEPLAEQMRLRPARERSWHGPLFQHLRPQLDEDQPVLRVAVTGGTNTGKSTIFNHLVGSAVSRMERFATRTKHPVCVLPKGSPHLRPESLKKLFPDFESRPWQSEDDAVADLPEDVLIFREDPTGAQSPRLLLLDTPDIDGVLHANWRRAGLIRNAADVLVVALTEQKYNDDAVIRFFREAARSDKTFIVVFNLVDWPADRELCLGWLRDFERETETHADFVYAVPKDRELAPVLALPFHPLSDGATDLRRDLADLRFAQLKIRSLRGSLLHVLDAGHGLPTFLAEFRARSREYVLARNTLRDEVCVSNIELPRPPGHLVWGPLWTWFETRRTRFDRLVHGFYNQVGRWISTPFRRGEPDLEREFVEREWDGYRRAVQQMLDKLRLLQQQGSEIVKAAVDQVLGGVHQEELFRQLRERHGQLPLINQAYHAYVQREMDDFERQRPDLLKLIRHGLVATAIVRPAITIGLLAIPGSELLAMSTGQAALATAHEAVTQAAIHVGSDAALAASLQVAVEGGGELSIRTLLSRLFSGFFQERNRQLLSLLNELIAGPVLRQISHLADVAESDTIQRAEQIMDELRVGVRGQNDDSNVVLDAPRRAEKK